MTDRQGVEIDYCPQCRGVWLDRGELDKIIERSLTAQPAARPASDQPLRDEVRRDGSRRYDYDDDDDDYRRRKRKSFLGEIFDF
jgi:Zn-finger nucleic acid-binding protein